MPDIPERDPRQAVRPAPIAGAPVPVVGAPAGAPVPLAAEPPPGFVSVIESTLKAPFAPKSVFGGFSASPAPSYGVLLANIALWNAVAVLLHAALDAGHGPSSEPPILTAVLSGAAVLIATTASFLLAGALHVLARLSGGRGAYGLAFRVVSLLSFLPAAGAMLAGVPAARAAIAAYSIVLAGVAVSLAYLAPGHQVGIVFAVAGGLAFAGERVAGRQLEQWRAEMPWLSGASPEPGAAVPGLVPGAGLRRGGGGPLAAGPASDGGQAPPGVDMGQIQQALDLASKMAGQAADAAVSPPSGLDLVRQGGVGGAVGASPEDGAGNPAGTPPAALPATAMPTPDQARRFSPEQMRQAQQAQLGLLQNMQKLLANPAMSKSMSPQEAQQMRQMQQLLTTVSSLYQKRSEGGQKVAGATDAETKQLLQQFKEIMGGLKAAQGGAFRGSAAPAPGSGPAPQAGGASAPPARRGGDAGFTSPMPLPPSADTSSGQ